MEQTISLPEQSSMDQRKARIIKIIAFSAFLLGIIYNYFFQGRIVRYSIDNGLQRLLDHAYTPIYIFQAVTWLSIAYLAPNRPARIMSCMMALCPFLLYFWFIPISLPYIFFLWAFPYVLSIYFLSGIFTNMSFSPNERKWSSILFLSHVGGLIFQIMRFFYEPSILNIESNRRLMDEWDACQFYTGDSYALYGWVLSLFSVIGMYKLCFSKSFSGSYDNSAKGTYTPVNKYVIGALVTTIITCGLLCLTLIFWNDIMNLL